MANIRFIWNMVAYLMLSSSFKASTLLVNKQRMYDTLMTSHLTSRRSSQDLAQHEKTRVFLEEKMKNITIGVQPAVTLQAPKFYWSQDFNGTNLVWTFPGTQYQSTADRPLIIGAHYDTVPASPGVNDNGSGLTVLLEVAAVLAQYSKCSRPNSIILVAFDLEETGLVGSHYFLQDHILPMMYSFGLKYSSFQGFICMDTLLNYDSTNNSQSFPQGFETVFSAETARLKKRQMRGDFLAAIGRQTDRPLLTQLQQLWTQGASYLEAIELPFSGRPSKLSSSIRPQFQDFFRSDHYNFWNDGHNLTNVPAVFLTDTAEHRGYMAECYHKACDNTSHVTEARMDFLAQTANMLALWAIEGTTSKQFQACNTTSTHTPTPYVTGQTTKVVSRSTPSPTGPTSRAHASVYSPPYSLLIFIVICITGSRIRT